MKTLVLGNLFKLTKAWFLLAHEHKDIRLHRLAYLTQFSIPTLLKPMISKMTDEGDVLLFGLLVIIGLEGVKRSRKSEDLKDFMLGKSTSTYKLKETFINWF